MACAAGGRASALREKLIKKFYFLNKSNRGFSKLSAHNGDVKHWALWE